MTQTTWLDCDGFGRPGREIHDLVRDFPSRALWYMASPYSKHPLGTQWAFQEACAAAAHLITYGLKVFSPIAHTHSIAHHGHLSPMDHDLWMPQDYAVMDGCVGMIVCQLTGWENSVGVQLELDYFRGLGKPVYFLPWKETNYAPRVNRCAAAQG